jgi:RNA polymerase sigma-70 factor (ECF subfamily)
MVAILKANDASPGRPPLAFDEVYETYFAQVERWARRLAAPGESAEDFVHDVFLVVHRRLPEWRGEAKVTTWLFAICERIGRKRRRRRRLARLMTVFDSASVQVPPAEGPSPHELAEKRQAHGHLYQALDQLSDKYRTPLILFEIEGVAGEQIAELLDLPLATVWVRLHRGRARLFELMTRRLDGQVADPRDVGRMSARKARP